MLASEGASKGNLASEVRNGDVFRAPCHMLEESRSRLISGVLRRDPDINHSDSLPANATYSQCVFLFGWNFEGTMDHTGLNYVCIFIYNMYEHLKVLYFLYVFLQTPTCSTLLH